MILLLFLICFGLTLGALKISRYSFFSPTFWASGMFLFYSFIYLITYKTMISDISLKTVLVITFSLFITALGEYCSWKIRCDFKIGKRRTIKSIYWNDTEIYIPKYKVYIITIIFLLVAISRFFNLIKFVRSLGNVNSSNLIAILGSARYAFIKANGNIALGNFFTNQLVYVSEISTYFFIFVYLHNMIVFKSNYLYLLLPLIPDVLLRIVSTSRTAFLMLFLVFLVLYFSIQDKDERIKRIRIPLWLIIFIFLFIVLFLLYGIARNNASSIPLVDYLQMYTSSAIYNLDYKLQYGWEPNQTFGFHSLSKIYKLFGIPVQQERQWGTGMLVFNVNGAHSNIYTSLLTPIQDFGYFVFFIIRFIEAFISGKIIKTFYYSSQTERKLYIWLYFSLMSIYCYFYYSTGSAFSGFFAQPSVMIRYFLYGWILFIILKPKGVHFQSPILKKIFILKKGV